MHELFPFPASSLVRYGTIPTVEREFVFSPRQSPNYAGERADSFYAYASPRAR